MYQTRLYSVSKRARHYSVSLPEPSWSVTQKYLRPHKVQTPTDEELHKLFRLCYLSPKNDFAKFNSDIEHILQCVTEIQSLDTSNVKPLFSTLDDIMEQKVSTCAVETNPQVESHGDDMPLKTRKDVVDSRFTKTADIIKNATVRHGNFFAVPKVKEDDVIN